MKETPIKIASLEKTLSESKKTVLDRERELKNLKELIQAERKRAANSGLMEGSDRLYTLHKLCAMASLIDTEKLFNSSSLPLDCYVYSRRAQYILKLLTIMHAEETRAVEKEYATDDDNIYFDE